MNKYLMSVGIDVGTATTQIVFSKIYLKNIASVFTVPRVEIEKTELFYASKIHQTPLIDRNIIDFRKIIEIVDYEYNNAKVTKEVIDIGAVIITGESARKENSEAVLAELSTYAGDFVVATAGADLESVIAAKGAKVDEYSKQNMKTIVNVDIGGGTSNYALVNFGSVVDTGCLDIGGKIVSFNENNLVTDMTTKAEQICRANNINLKVGEVFKLEELKQFAKICAISIFDYLEEDYKSKSTNTFVTHKQMKVEKYDYICFSGGVSEFIYNESSSYEVKDLGYYLAQEIKAVVSERNIKLHQPEELIRATVFGAGMHTTKISGSTIYFDDYDENFKNITAVKVKDSELELSKNLYSTTKQKIEWYEQDELKALCFELNLNLNYNELEKIAQEISVLLNELPQMEKIVFIENDYAKVLGNIIKPKLDKHSILIVIDSVVISENDYIDISKPVEGSTIIPVVTKTIIFN